MLTDAIDALLEQFQKSQIDIDRAQARLNREESIIADTTVHPDWDATNAETQRTYQAWCATWGATIVPALLDAGLTQQQIDQLGQGVHDELDRHVESILRAAKQVA